MNEKTDKLLYEIPKELKINYEAKNEAEIKKIYKNLSDFLIKSELEEIIQFIDDICLDICVPLSLSATLNNSIFKKSEFIFSKLIEYASAKELFTGLIEALAILNKLNDVNVKIFIIDNLVKIIKKIKRSRYKYSVIGIQMLYQILENEKKSYISKMMEFEEFEFNSISSNCLMAINAIIEDMKSLLSENYDENLERLIIHHLPPFITMLIPIYLEINFLKEINNLKNNSDFVPLNLNLIKSLIQNFKLENEVHSVLQESWHSFISEDLNQDDITEIFNLNKSLILCLNLTYDIILDIKDDMILNNLDIILKFSKLDISHLKNSIYINYALEALNCIIDKNGNFKFNDEIINEILNFLLCVLEDQPVFVLKRSSYKIIEKIILNISTNKITWSFFKIEIFKASENVAPLLLQLFKTVVVNKWEKNSFSGDFPRNEIFNSILKRIFQETTTENVIKKSELISVALNLYKYLIIKDSLGKCEKILNKNDMEFMKDSYIPFLCHVIEGCMDELMKNGKHDTEIAMHANRLHMNVMTIKDDIKNIFYK